MLRSFRATLIAFTVAAVLLPVLGVSIPFAVHIYRITREGAVRELRLSAGRVATLVSHELNISLTRFLDASTNKDLILAADNPFFLSPATTVSESFLQQSPIVESVYLLNARLEAAATVPEVAIEPELGRLTQAIRVALPDPARLRWQAKVLWLDDRALLNQIYRSHRMPESKGDARMLVFIAPLFVDQYLQSDSNKLKGVLVAVIPIERLAARAKESLGSSQSLELLSPQEAALAHTAPDEQQALASVVVDATGARLDFVLRVAEPSAVRFARTDQTLRTLCIFLAVITLSLALAAYLLARRLGRPLHYLEDTANRYASGDYSDVPGRADFTEFRRVADTLRDMGQHIGQQFEALHNANTQLKLADKLKDDFLACTSHELRTPLHGIVGLASSLVDGAGGALAPKVKNDLQLITQSGKRLEQLVNDILDFAKIRHQALTLSCKPVELYSLVDIVLSLHTAEAQQKGLSLRNAVPQDLPLAWADEYRVQQVLHNLIGNGLKFTPQGLVTVRAGAEGAHLRIAVEDTGIGIAPEMQARIFDPFIQVENPLTRTRPGTGLGLSISRQLVEMQGGSVSVSSIPGQGASFTFTLPIATDQNLAAPALMPHTASQEPSWNPELPEWAVVSDDEVSTTPALPTHHARVLLVDDEPINLEILGNYFFSEPYTLYRANSGTQAMEWLAHCEGVDLILLDVMMPKMSGFEVCRRIRSDPRFADVPILFLTARDQARDIHLGFALGANDYLVKPVSRAELLTRCQYHIHYGRVKSELASLNQSLEHQVAHRTEALEATLAVIQRHNDVFRALLEISIELQSREDLAEGLQRMLEKLTLLYPQRGFCVALRPVGDSRTPRLFTQLPAELERVVSAHYNHDDADNDWAAAHDLLRLPLWGARQKRLGDLLIWPATLDGTERETIEIASRQLAAVVENRRLTDALEQMAVTDPLTGAYNRRFFEKAFATQCYRFGRHPDVHFALISVDVNGLKQVNDQYGHEAGDALIMHVVDIIRELLRQTDIVCRVGGDEFVVIAEAAGLTVCELLVERFRKAQEHAEVMVTRCSGENLRVPVRYAVGAASTEEAAPGELLRLADQRMYVHKQACHAAADRRAPPSAQALPNC